MTNSGTVISSKDRQFIIHGVHGAPHGGVEPDDEAGAQKTDKAQSYADMHA